MNIDDDDQRYIQDEKPRESYNVSTFMSKQRNEEPVSQKSNKTKKDKKKKKHKDKSKEQSYPNFLDDII